MIRLLATFAFWSVAFAGLSLSGVSHRTGELACAAGAGLTLIGWGVGLRFRRSGSEAPARSETAADERQAGS